MMWCMTKKREVKVNNRQERETGLEWLASNCGVFVLGLFAFTFIFQNFVIPSSSMASTLQVGDHVMVEREMLAPAARWMPLLPYRDVRRGDVVVFYKPIPEA